MDTLKIIQKISQIGKILSRIVFVVCIVGFCIGVVGLVSVAVGVPAFKLGAVDFNLIQNAANLSDGAVCAGIIVGMLLCATEAVLAKFAEHYFAREEADGTPFCKERAAELLRLGILTICIPLITQIAGAIVTGVFAEFFHDVSEYNMDNAVSVGLGVMFIILSLFCKCGAELLEEKTE